MKNLLLIFTLAFSFTALADETITIPSIMVRMESDTFARPVINKKNTSLTLVKRVQEDRWDMPASLATVSKGILKLSEEKSNTVLVIAATKVEDVDFETGLPTVRYSVSYMLNGVDMGGVSSMKNLIGFSLSNKAKPVKYMGETATPVAYLDF